MDYPRFERRVASPDRLHLASHGEPVVEGLLTLADRRSRPILCGSSACGTVIRHRGPLPPGHICLREGGAACAKAATREVPGRRQRVLAKIVLPCLRFAPPSRAQQAGLLATSWAIIVLPARLSCGAGHTRARSQEVAADMRADEKWGAQYECVPSLPLSQAEVEVNLAHLAAAPARGRGAGSYRTGARVRDHGQRP
jgi:hypothetical protein